MAIRGSKIDSRSDDPRGRQEMTAPGALKSALRSLTCWYPKGWSGGASRRRRRRTTDDDDRRPTTTTLTTRPRTRKTCRPTPTTTDHRRRREIAVPLRQHEGWRWRARNWRRGQGETAIRNSVKLE
eukprot:6532011-Pyramimonas_sp.AAC.1